jgi:enamine deaminase RidA (YjgF/YER057c/UK114 family)
MAYTTIVSEHAKPVSNYKMGTRQESGRLLYISGQVAWDADGNIVGKDDIRTQAQQVFHNLGQVLQEAGGDLQDLLKITTYVTDIDNYPAVIEVRNAIFQGELPASTLIVVAGLFHEDFLLEIEATAAIG